MPIVLKKWCWCLPPSPTLFLLTVLSVSWRTKNFSQGDKAGLIGVVFGGAAGQLLGYSVARICG